MYSYSNNKKQNQSQESLAVQSTVAKPTFALQDNRPRAVAKKNQINALTNKPVQKKVNNTGLPGQLKMGIENLSGHSMDDVKVHYNSAKPAQLNAHAYAQGTEIHVAAGQEKYLPHEAWHIVQQKQGRVKPTMQMKGKVNVNDDKTLENEADIMGGKALTSKIPLMHITSKLNRPNNIFVSNSIHAVAQLNLTEKAKAELKRLKDAPKSNLEASRKEIMEKLEPDFVSEYNSFYEADKANRSNEPLKKIEITTALREYVKALTSTHHKDSDKDWDDVAILHKRKSKKQGPPFQMDDETEKYATIGHHTTREWGMGNHHTMEESGQIYGPATAGLGITENEGRHSWGSNAAWLLGHMHAGHRFIQVVPHTEDNLLRGSKDEDKGEAEVGALAFEALGIMKAGYKKARQEETMKLWTEYTPGDGSSNMKLSNLARPKIVEKRDQETEIQATSRTLREKELFNNNNIELADVIKLDESAGSNALHKYEEKIGFHNGGKVIGKGRIKVNKAAASSSSSTTNFGPSSTSLAQESKKDE